MTIAPQEKAGPRHRAAHLAEFSYEALRPAGAVFGEYK